MKSVFVFIITTVITGTTAKTEDDKTMIDTFLSQQLPIGDTKVKLADAIEHIEKSCTDGLGQRIGAKEREMAKQFFESIIPKKELAEKAVNYELEKTLHWPENIICQQLTKVTKLAAEIDKYAGEAKKIRTPKQLYLSSSGMSDT